MIDKKKMRKAGRFQYKSPDLFLFLVRGRDKDKKRMWAIKYKITFTVFGLWFIDFSEIQICGL